MIRHAPEPGGGSRNQNSAKDSSGLGPRGRTLLKRMFKGRGRDKPVSPALHEARSIAIASGKGGTGKSFLATSLAVVLHQKLRRITLVDCDFGLACDHLLLGVTPKLTLQQILAGRARLRDVRIATPFGPFLVPGGSGIRQMADLNDHQLLILGEMLAQLACMEEVMLLDVGAGITPQNVLTLLSADHILLVTQPEIAALTDAYAVIKCCTQLRQDAQFSVVVNRVMAEGQGRQTFDKLASVTRRHIGTELQYLGEVADNPLVTQRRLGKRPLVVTDPKGPTASSIQAIAQRLEEVAGPLVSRTVQAENSLASRFKAQRLFLC